MKWKNFTFGRLVSSDVNSIATDCHTDLAAEGSHNRPSVASSLPIQIAHRNNSLKLRSTEGGRPATNLEACRHRPVLIVGRAPLRTIARKQTYRETSPGPNKFTPIGFAIPAAFGKYFPRKMRRDSFESPGRTKQFVIFMPTWSTMVARRLGGWCRLLTEDSSHLASPV